ncbi:hypothetical protein AXF42_Ash007993 [Apostasia shenzhenica]|uniref:Ankyrin repeat domain-containing protein n=1 Tax=Apostasia shenzhenica TaxID=1088818 RepID=A0A2I0A8B6_9ASPA|nr:hypothetical protein AXF42_Ash007993 [Apostasia shenzhenica]
MLWKVPELRQARRRCCRRFAAMSRTNIFRPGIDVTQAVLVLSSHGEGRRKTEMVGSWKAKVYDMHNVVVSVKSRRVPGAMTDEEFFSCL